MPNWTNQPLSVFHGTDSLSAQMVAAPSGGKDHSIRLDAGRGKLDFGRGFYVTTVLQQAKDWADRRMDSKKLPKGTKAAVIEFKIDRKILSGLDDLFFSDPRGGGDFWNFVTYCRNETPPMHGPHGTYSIVCGPVTLWPQRQLMRDCDQISFHTENALNVLRSPNILYSNRSHFREDKP